MDNREAKTRFLQVWKWWPSSATARKIQAQTRCELVPQQWSSRSGCCFGPGEKLGLGVTCGTCQSKGLQRVSPSSATLSWEASASGRDVSALGGCRGS